MTPNEVKMYYKTGYNFNMKTGMSENNLKNWLTCGYIPYKSQRKLEQITAGELIAVWDDKEPFFSPIKDIK